VTQQATANAAVVSVAASPARRRRRAGQRAVRATVILLLLLAALYVFLPWWLPAGLVRDYVTETLSAQTGLDVQIGDVDVSWGRGLILRDLQIASPPGCRESTMIRARQMTADFSPMDILRGEMAWMEIVGLEAHVETVPDGRWNIASLRPLEGTVQPRRLSVREASVAFRASGADGMRTLKVADFQLVRDRRDRIRHMSLTGHIEQPDGPAAVILQLVGGGPVGEAGPEARCLIQNLDLASLPLSPESTVHRLAGRCGGRLAFTLDTHGKIDRIDLDADVRGLELADADGLVFGPVGEASLQVDASYDAFSDRIDVQAARIRMPGAVLEGRAIAYTDFLSGRWQSLEAAELNGRVQPGRLRELLPRSRPGAMEIDGPVALHAAARRDAVSRRMELELTLDARQAELRHAGRAVKRSGLPTSLQLQADTDEATGTVELRHFSLALGRNEITAEAGDIPQAGQVIRTLLGTDRRVTDADWLQALSHVSVRGTIRLCDADILATALHLRPQQLATTGEMRGTWSLTRGEPCWLRVGLESPAGSDLAVGELFGKPVDQSLRLDLTAGLHADDAAIRDLQLDLQAGQGSLQMRNGQADLSGHDGRGGGSFEAALVVSGVEHFVAMFPSACDEAGPFASGRMTGRVHADVDGLTSRGVVAMDASPARLRWSQIWQKSVGEPLELSVSWCNRNDRNETSLHADADWWQATLDVTAPARDATQHYTAVLEVDDLGELQQASPALARRLGERRIEGRLGIRARQDRRGAGDSPVHLRCSLDRVGLLDKTGEVARAWREMSLDVGMRVAPVSPDGTRRIEITSGRTTAPGLDVHDIGGEFAIAIDNGPREAAEDWLAGVRSGRFGMHLTARPETLLAWAAPAANREARRIGLGDESSAAVTIEVDEKGVVADIEAALALLTFTRSDRTDGKAVRLKSRALLSRARDRGSPVIVESFEADAPGVEVSADGRLALSDTDQRTDLRVRLDLADAGRLLGFIPELRDDGWTDMSGRMQANMHWLAGPATGDGHAESLRLQFDEFTGVRRDLPVRLDGRTDLAGLARSAGGIRLRQLATSDLEFRVGDTHGWLVADVTTPRSQPRGEVHLLFESLNDRQIIEWLSGQAVRKSTGALTDADVADLERNASCTIERMRSMFAGADATLRITADRYTAYDVNVDQQYDVRNLHLRAEARDGRLSLVCDAGLNGGTMHQELTTRLTQDAPKVHRVTVFREVEADEAIRPQISMTFPGNTVYGQFSRDEDVELSLQGLLAKAVDPRYRTTLTGEAALVATDGVVVGRAAPNFVTKIFPGLNLTKYRYDRMTGYTTFLADGTQKNETIFTGVYDVYMEGTTDRDNVARYTLGLVLLPTRVSHEWHRDWKQGRFPILKIKGTIRDGRLINDEVSYPWPNETLFEVFLQNNLVYRAWMNFRGSQPVK
jgi:hypothetical protein